MTKTPNQIKQTWKENLIFFGIMLLVFLCLIYNGHKPHMGIGDGRGYERFAGLFFTPSKWMGRGTFKTIPSITHMRLLGYPFIIFITKALSSQFWPWILVSLQFLVHGFSLWYVRSFLRESHLPSFFIILALLFLTGGEVIRLCFLSLTDSLFISFSLIFSTFCLKLFGNFGRKDLILGSLALGFLFFLRESGLFYFLFHTPLLAFYIFRKNWRIRLRSIYPIFLVLPFLLAVYGTWNYYRFGHFFITTVSRIMLASTVIQNIDKTEEKNDPIIKEFKDKAEDYPILRAEVEGQDFWKKYSDLAVILFDSMKHKGITNILEQNQYTHNLYFKLWKNHPLKMLKHTKEEITKNNFSQGYHPVTHIIPKGIRIAP